jgi:hypothetical protein
MNQKTREVEKFFMMFVGYAFIRIMSYVMFPRPYEFSHQLLDFAVLVGLSFYARWATKKG